MPRAARYIGPLLLIAALAACHNDPFSMKPEVPGVKIPPKSAPVETPAPDESETPAPDAQP